ncbi:MAG: L-type lectin-domain containing protein, partial [Phycisphaerales bacterium]
MKLSHKIGFSRGVIAALAVTAGTAVPAMADFSYADFTTAPNISFVGAAVHSAPTLSVTPPIRASAGAVWRSDAQRVVDGFVSNFTFRISDITGLGSDGLAFVIHNDSRGNAAIGGSGGAMGYATNTVFPSQTGIANGVAIEFDTWNNQGDWEDFNSAHHVSVQTMGQLTMVPSGLASLGHAATASDFGDNAVHTVRVVYVPGTLDVYLDNLLTPLVSVPLNLGSILDLPTGDAFVGFTAGTGAFTNVERHGILSWD